MAPTIDKSVREDFLHAPEYLNFNHGSFGTYTRQVKTVFRQLQEDAESRPDVFIRYTYPRLLDQARAELAKFLNVDTNEVVIIQNATTGFNTVLRNIEWQEGDVIIQFDTIYGGHEKSVKYITETTPAESVKIRYTYPVSDQWLLEAFRETIRDIRRQGKNPRLATFDTIVSMPGVRMPYEELLKICQEEKVLSFLDGAHGVGMLAPKDLDLGALKPDFFVSNLHKWLFVPRGCAVFYVAHSQQKYMRSTLPTSHGFVARLKPGEKPLLSPLPYNPKPPFVANFEFVGTIDNAPFLCVSTAFAYRRDRLGGEDAVNALLFSLARDAGRLVSKQLGTETMENKEGTLGRCAFSNVRLPLDAAELVALVGEDQKAALGGLVRDWMSLVLVKEYDTFMAFMWYGGAWWVRLSAQVYLDMDDFQKGANVLTEVCGRVKRGEFKNAIEVACL